MSKIVTNYTTLPEVIILKIKLFVIFIPKTKNELQDAVDLWNDDKNLAHKLYGHISLWDTKYITDMSYLCLIFAQCLTNH